MGGLAGRFGGVDWMVLGRSDPRFARVGDDLHRLRHRVFKERMGWEVSSDGEREADAFDVNPRTRYVVAERQGRVVGCLRLVPTTSGYMLERVFPEVAGSDGLPKEDGVWELSRFAVAEEPEQGAGAGAARFREATLALVDGMMEFARTGGIGSFVAVTTPTIERLVRSLGMECSRHGGMVRIGGTRVIALRVGAGEASAAALRAERIRMEFAGDREIGMPEWADAPVAGGGSEPDQPLADGAGHDLVAV